LIFLHLFSAVSACLYYKIYLLINCHTNIVRLDCQNNIVRIEFWAQLIRLSAMKKGLCLPYCVCCTPLTVRLAMCVVCCAAGDWLWVTWEDPCCVYELIEGVVFTELLLHNQHFTLMQYLHIYIASQHLMHVPFWHVFSSCNVSAIVPYSCLFCKMCNA